MASERPGAERASQAALQGALRQTRGLAMAALALALVALVLAGYALHAQREAEENLRRIGRELSRQLAPELPLRPPPLGLDPDDT